MTSSQLEARKEYLLGKPGCLNGLTFRLKDDSFSNINSKTFRSIVRRYGGRLSGSITGFAHYSVGRPSTKSDCLDDSAAKDISVYDVVDLIKERSGESRSHESKADTSSSLALQPTDQIVSLIDLYSDAEGDDHEDCTSSELANELRVALDYHLQENRISTPVATDGAPTSSVNPGLVIHGLGEVGLPLSSRDAEAIFDLEYARIGECAPTKQGNRVCLTTDEFALGSPEWIKAVDSIVQEVSEDLGIPESSSVIATLEGLDLLGEGAQLNTCIRRSQSGGSSTTHRLGTLEIYLPSLHFGGQTRLTCDDEGYVYSQSSEYDVCYAAWLANVRQNMNRISHGHRMSLRYILSSPRTPDLHHAERLVEDKRQLHTLLRKWAIYAATSDSTESPPTRLTYVLSQAHETAMENALSVGQLDRENLRKIRHLEAASADTGVLILLGNLERTAHSGWNEGTASEVDVSMRIRRVTDLQGRTVATNLPVEDNDLVQTTYFAGVEPDREDEDYDDHGVYGTVKRTWTRTVAIVMPKTNFIDLALATCDLDARKASGWLETLTTSFRSNRENAQARKDLQTMCHYALSDANVNQEVLHFVASASIELDELSLFEEAVNVLYLSSAETRVALAGKLSTAQDGDGIRWLKVLIRRKGSITDRLMELSHIEQYLPSREAERFTPIFHRAVVDILASARPESADVDSLIDLAMSYGDEWLLNSLLPVLKSKTDHAKFTVELLSQLYDLGNDGEIKEGTTKTIFRVLLRGLLSCKRTSTFCALGEGLSPTGAEIVTGDALSSLIDECWALELWEEADSLLDLAAQHTTDIANSRLGDFAMSFLKRLIASMALRGVASSDGVVQKNVRSIVAAYVHSYVGLQPEVPKDWSRRPRGCGCDVCEELDHFLRSPFEYSTQFEVREDGWRHLEDQVIGGYRSHGAENDRGDSFWIDTPQVCVLEIIKGEPFCKLEMTKTMEEYKADLGAWERRKANAEMDIRGLPEVAMREILGDAYDNLQGLDPYAPLKLGKAQRMHDRHDGAVGLARTTSIKRPKSESFTVNERSEKRQRTDSRKEMKRSPLMALPNNSQFF